VAENDKKEAAVDPAANATHRYIGTHAQELVKGESSYFVGAGDFVTLSAEDLEDPVTAELVESGLLLDMKGGEAK